MTSMSVAVASLENTLERKGFSVGDADRETGLDLLGEDSPADTHIRAQASPQLPLSSILEGARDVVF
ncbi:hypothetical protein KIPB_002232 [Kipferlia bialata]|nr:hypothetical protein KIPB_002232 [Kipferlia bialata]|eukprot:g2232.t1